MCPAGREEGGKHGGGGGRGQITYVRKCALRRTVSLVPRVGREFLEDMQVNVP